MTNKTETKWRRILREQERLETELDARRQESVTLERRLAAIRDELQWLDSLDRGT
jgi:hypothetical protein